MKVEVDLGELNEMRERIRMLQDIALSAICLKLNIEHGFPPRLHALDRDLAAYQRRFEGIMASEPPAERAKRRPENYATLPVEEQWKIDRALGILDWDGKS